jgi:hypothetical protein
VIALVSNALNSGSVAQIQSAKTQLAALSGQGCPDFAPADFNNDAAINVFDLLHLLSEWGGGSSDADLNHDGVVNVFDMLLILSAWGPAPPQWQPQ